MGNCLPTVDFTLACCRFQSRDGTTLPPRSSPDLTRPPVVLAPVVPANPRWLYAAEHHQRATALSGQEADPIHGIPPAS